MQDHMQDATWRQALAGSQMLFVAFGALVLMPLITGLDPNVALFTAGLGTLLFQLMTGRQVPVFLASSFAFITPIILAKQQFGLAETMGGVMAAGFVYTFLGAAVKIKGTGFIDRLLPPVVIGPVIISIGLAMAPIAANMAMGKAGDGAELLPYSTAMMISMPALLTTLIVAVFGKGIFRLVPIIAGVLVGFGLSFYFGVVDTAKIAAAPWLAMPAFVAFLTWRVLYQPIGDGINLVLTQTGLYPHVIDFLGQRSTAMASVIAASVWLLLFAYQDVPYSHQLWWQFTLDADAPRGLRAAMGSALLLAAVALTWLLRTAPPVIHLPDEEELQRANRILQASDQPDGGLALTGDKALLFHPRGNAFLMYARRGRSLVALYDPIGPAQERAEMIWQFRDLCDLHHARPVFYQVRAENLPYYMDIGLTAIKLGEEARVDLLRFDLDAKGKEMKDLRYTWNRGTRDGLSLEIHEPGQAPMDELKVISDAWLTGKNVREKGFSLGRFSDDYLKHFRIAVIRFEGRPVAFANLLETYSHDLASLDLMRAHPDAPKLTMEFMMVGLIQHYKSHGYARFSLGMVPLSGLQPRRGAPLTQRLGSMVFQRGEQLYNFQGLRRFKDKFQPDWEPRYMAVPAGLDPLVALADTAALIAGGLTGLVKR